VVYSYIGERQLIMVCSLLEILPVIYFLAGDDRSQIIA
jgi:hypothetical protein